MATEEIHIAAPPFVFNHPMTTKLVADAPAPDIWQQWLAEETTCLKEKDMKQRVSYDPVNKKLVLHGPPHSIVRMLAEERLHMKIMKRKQEQKTNPPLDNSKENKGKDEEREPKQKTQCKGGGWYVPGVDRLPPLDHASLGIPPRTVKSVGRYVPGIQYPWLDEW